MSSKKILVIDDDQTILEIVENILTQYEFEPILANNGEDGLNKAEEHQPHTILLDRKMPNLSGIEVLKKLKKNSETKNIPVVMLTGDNNINEVAKSLELGADDYIVKPFNNENLIMRVKNVLHER